jgi:uncharacterized repeat protein (TIGR03803 family)
LSLIGSYSCRCPEKVVDAGHASPAAALVQATNGNLYGTTLRGGLDAAGTIFEITTAGALTTLYSACANSSGCTGGVFPVGLIQASDGNFYGTDTRGGPPGEDGTVFMMTPQG